MKRCVLLATMMLSVVLSVYAQDAAVIMERAQNKNDSSTMSSRSRMVITPKNGSATERVIDQYSKEDAQGRNRSIIIFQSPATVKGTRFLTLENNSGDSDQWIFLPGIGKVRRIASSESGGNFMGTDFSYNDMDMTSRDVSEDTHTVIGEEVITVDGSNVLCYRIQSVPKDADFQYSKMITWVDKENSRIYKRDLYNDRGGIEKNMEISGYKDVQGFDTATQIKMSTLAAGTSTTLHSDIIKYDDPIPEGVFTTAFLETGRVR